MLQSSVLERIHFITNRQLPVAGESHDLMRAGAIIIDATLDDNVEKETAFERRLSHLRRQRALALQSNFDRSKHWLAIEFGYATDRFSPDH